jgi:putative ABC transport system ATP-binding protein
LGAFLFTHSQPIKNLSVEAKPRRSAILFSKVRFAWHPTSGHVLDIPRLTIESGQHVFIAGPSGSGKSTLLSLLAGISVPQAGQIDVLGHRLEKMGGSARDRFRADHMGVIFQMFNLVPYLSVVENVTLPCRFSRRRAARTIANGGPETEAGRLLYRLGISQPLLNRPVTSLSVGQQQRVAAARALIGAPELIIADEPTSSLDAGHRRSFIRLLFEECDKSNATLIFVSHDIALAPLFHRTIELNTINQVASSEPMEEGGTR